MRVLGAQNQQAGQAAFAAYDLQAVRTYGYNALTNRPKEAAYRAPGAPMGAFAVESVIDELCKKLGLDPIEVRLKNAAREPEIVDLARCLRAMGAACELHRLLLLRLAAGAAPRGALAHWIVIGSVAVELAVANAVTIARSIVRRYFGDWPTTKIRISTTPKAMPRSRKTS